MDGELILFKHAMAAGAETREKFEMKGKI